MNGQDTDFNVSAPFKKIKKETSHCPSVPRSYRRLDGSQHAAADLQQP